MDQAVIAARRLRRTTTCRGLCPVLEARFWPPARTREIDRDPGACRGGALRSAPDTLAMEDGRGEATSPGAVRDVRGCRSSTGRAVVIGPWTRRPARGIRYNSSAILAVARASLTYTCAPRSRRLCGVFQTPRSQSSRPSGERRCCLPAMVADRKGVGDEHCQYGS